MELVSSGIYGNEHYYIYEKTTIDEVGQRTHSFFEGERYRLEKGTNLNGIYGTGNAFLRALLGALVKRYKFNIEIKENDGNIRLSVRGAMSGFSGGLVGKSQMGRELKRITDNLKLNF